MTLRVVLERALPESLPAGRPNVVLLAGRCGREVTRLEVLVDGEAHRLTAVGSRFWGTVPIAARTPARVPLTLRAQLRGGGSELAELGEIELVAREAEPAGIPTPGLIAVCMATYEPDMDLFRAQVRSLREQTDGNWTCLVSDDCSSPERFAEIEAELGSEDRFRVSRSPERLGFYRNFERALGMVPSSAELIALCDQDDRWHPGKLAALRAALDTGAVLAYSDLRLVEADGRVLRETLWRGRANNHTDLVSMLVANTITGAATLFRRSLLDALLPFPDTPGFQFHDHWLAVAALALGEVAYVDRPLYDYVQHRGAVFGHVTHGEPPAGVEHSLAERWRAAYFYGYLARRQQAEVLLARAGAALDLGKRGALERFVAADGSLTGPLWLALRTLRLLAGRTETLASELELVKGLLWLHAARRLGLDAAFPPLEAFTQKRLRRWRAGVRDTSRA